MFWNRRQKPAEPKPSLIAFLDEKTTTPPDAEKELAEALSRYETEFYKKISSASDEKADRAKKVVEQARTFIRDSRLAYAICRPLLEHVQYWPSWSKHKNFQKYVQGPLRYIDGYNETRTESKPSTTVVTFSYNSTVYTIRFVDNGMFSWAPEDTNTYGKLELITGDKTVLGLDVSKDLSKEFDHWRMVDVYAFLPGPWMKEIIEIAAYIDGTNTREREMRRNNDAIERAKGINFPPPE
jgi:hypothetical protein